MPRYVDHDARRAEIATAAMRILARSGPQSLTLKSLAEEMGGSITLVTHFVANRNELFTVLIDDLTESYAEMLGELDRGADSLARLWILVSWMVPTTPSDIDDERARIALISHRHEHSSIDHFFVSMEERMRGLLAHRLEGLLPAAEVPHAVEYLRAVTNGVTLSAVEHPARWPADRALHVLRTALLGLGLQLGEVDALHVAPSATSA